MGQQSKRHTIHSANQFVSKGFSLIELVVLISVMGIVSAAPLAILFLLSTTNTDLQHENHATLKLQNLMAQIEMELQTAHPFFLEINEDQNRVSYQQVIAFSEAEALAQDTVMDDALHDMDRIQKGMRLVFAPYRFSPALYRITAVQNGMMKVKNVKDYFPKEYAVVSAEGAIYLENNTLMLDKTYYSNHVKRLTSGLLCDFVSRFSVSQSGSSSIEITIVLMMNQTRFPKTKRMTIGIQ